MADLVTKEVTNLDKFFHRTQQNVDVLLGGTWTLIDEIRSFNKDYAEALKLKKESDQKVFKGIKNSLMSFHDHLSKFDVQSTTSIS